MLRLSQNRHFSPQQELATVGSLYLCEEGLLSACQLGEEDRAEVLQFLSCRPSHTFGLCGFIRANGLVSPLNRGSFFACRDAEGRIQGVALIGHHILFETASEAVIRIFAQLAQTCSEAFVLLAEQEKAERFWHHYAASGKAIHLCCRELLMEQRWPLEVQTSVTELRVATLADLDLVAPAHAQIAFQESGSNPLERDPKGFLARYARRIENGQTFVWVEDGRLIFKADIICETTEVIYLEGIWVQEEARGQGIGHRCLSQLTHLLLQRSQAVCLLVNEGFHHLQEFYRKAGYKVLSRYDTLYLQEKPNPATE